MMKEYVVLLCTDEKINWSRVPVLPIDYYQTKPKLPVSAMAQLCWNSDAIFVRMAATESKILARFTGDYAPVCADSCLEMFVSPYNDDGRYFNFECNPNGATNLGFGYGRNDRIRLILRNIHTRLAVETFRKENTWGVLFKLPLKVLQLFQPGFTLCAGVKMRANFYKCGDDIIPRHELMWNPITNGKVDFHQPCFFGNLLISDIGMGNE